MQKQNSFRYRFNTKSEIIQKPYSDNVRAIKNRHQGWWESWGHINQHFICFDLVSFFKMEYKWGGRRVDNVLPRRASLRESDWSLGISNPIRPDVMHLLISVPGKDAKEGWPIAILNFLSSLESAYIPAVPNSGGSAFNPRDKQKSQIYRYSKNVMRPSIGKM